jgi:hypothetical protein
MRMEGDSNAERFAVSSEVIIDSSHAIQIEVCSFTLKTSWTFGHEGRNLKVGGEFNPPFVNLMGWMGYVEGDVRTTNGSDLYTDGIANLSNATRGTEPIERLTGFPAVPASLSELHERLF